MTKKKAKKKPTATPEPDSPQDASGSFQPDLRLPPRLFATDRFPTKRLNIYSSPEILPFLRHVLRDTKEFQIIRESCFGKLFDIPARQCPVSAKLIHSFLTRQLVCLPKNTLWSVFGGNPLRYGLQEFGTVTGLNCASFPEGYHPDTAKPVVAGKDEVWKRLFGKKTMVTIAELCLMLEEDKKMEHWKKIRIALIIIVDGVLIAHKQQARATPRYVKMLKNLKTFFAFPWGRESFLKQDSFRLQSFPLTLQLVAFRAIPQLLSFIPAEPDQRTLMDLEDGYLPQHKSIDSIGVRRVEFSSDLAVSPIIPIESQPQSGWGEWPNDPKDDCVIYMEQLIADQFTFNKGMWPAGVTTEPLLIKPKARGHRKGMFPTRVKQSLKPKKVIKKETSSRKQRRISSYFTRSSVASFTNEQLSEMVLKLQKQMKQLHKLLQKKKKTSHPMQRSFHTLISRSKKPATSHKARHEAPIHQDVPDTSHHQHQPVQAPPLDDDHPTDQDVDAMETDEQPSSQSPIISHSPDSVETIHTPTVHGLSDHNHTTVHTSPDHNSDSEMIPPDENTTNTIPEDDIQTTPNQPIVPPHPHRHLSNRPEPKSVIYDKSDHPNSPEINHILCHGLRIYDPISPDPPLSNPPIFDSTIGPSSAPDIPLRLSPLSFTPLTSPAKSNDSGLGFLSHTATPNAFAATASTSPPVIGRPTIVPAPADESQGDDEAVIDLTQTKDPPRHVPSMEQNHLAKELFSSPLVPAIALISPLPQMEWDLFEKILKANINVYHTTRFEFEFSNKSLLQLAEPKQWTTTYPDLISYSLFTSSSCFYKILKQIRKHELFLLFLTIQHKESNCWHPNYLLVWIEADYIRGSDEGESLPKVLPLQIRRTVFSCNFQRKTEHHLFKWVDEAIVDEVNMVDAKHNQLKEDVDSFKIYTTQCLEKQAIQFDKALIQLNSLIADKATSSGTNDNSTIATKDTLQPPNQPSDANNSRAQLINIAVAAIVVGTMTWIYAKITN
ncbi:unnamed protein product [Brassica rapa]|uniref:DUF1985 domain-containing protein n=1 Tax=Brassica campestris TaxID=3711 RepID=A0A8D9M1X3_BRACM|nr:unnamed protein product [Brassica rapa]